MEPVTLGVVVGSKGLWDEVQACLSRLPVRVLFERNDISDWPAFLDQVERLGPDIVLVDISGLTDPVEESIRRIRAVAGAPTVIALHPSAEPEKILAAMRAGAGEFLFPPMEAGLLAAIERLGGERVKQRSPVHEGGRLYGFLSAKGGCGATTIACHVAVECQRLTRTQVLLADFDLEAGMVGFLMKAQNPYSVTDVAKNVFRLDASYWKGIISNGRPGLEIVRAPEVTVSRELPRPEQLRHVLRFARFNYRFGILDLGRSLNLYSIHALEEINEAFLVATLDVPALHHAKQIIRTVLDTGFGRDRLRLLINRMPRNPEITTEEIEKSLGLPVYMTLPSDYPALYESYAEGTLLPANSCLARHFRRLASRITGIDDEKDKKGKFSLFG